MQRFKDKKLEVSISNHHMNSIDICKNRWIESEALVAIAFHKQLTEEINRQYIEDEIECVKAFASSELSEAHILNILPTPIRATAVKCFSLYALHELSRNEDAWILTLANKGYKRFIDFAKSNIDYFSWNSFFNFIEKRNPEVGTIQMNHIAVLILRIIGEPVFKSVYTIECKDILYNLWQSNSPIQLEDKEFIELRNKNQLIAIDKLKSTLGIKIPKEQSIDWIFQEHESYVFKRLVSKSDKNIVRNTDNYTPIYKKGLLKYYKSLTTNLRILGINDAYFSELASITREDLVSIYAVFEASRELEMLVEGDWEMFLTASILLIMMINHYKELSDFYFTSEKKKEELILKEDKLKQDSSELDKATKFLSTSHAFLEEKLKEKDEYIASLELQLKKMREEQEEQLSLRKEVAALRTYAYLHNQEQDENTEAIPPIERVKTIFIGKKVTLFGGHPKLVNKIKEVLPYVKHRDVDTLNRNLDFLYQQDIVLIFTNYFSHSFYYKLMEELEGYPEVKIIYLSGYANIDRTLKEIADSLESSL